MSNAHNLPRITERVVEVPWMLERLGENPGRVLDVGSFGADYLDELGSRAGELVLCDPRFTGRYIAYQRFGGSVQKMAKSGWAEYFDVITCISTLDHIGLEVYGQRPAADAFAAQVDAVAAMYKLLRPDGRLLLTVPIGRPAIGPLGDNPQGQEVYSLAEIDHLFPYVWPGNPDARWLMLDTRYWRLVGDEYRPANALACTGATHDGYRAGAVIAIDMKKVSRED